MELSVYVEEQNNIFDFPVLIPDLTHGGKAMLLFIESLNKR